MGWVLTRQSGFTLLELLVVITLLGVIAGVAILGYEGVREQGQYDAAQYEMAEIKKALLQFRRDSGANNFPHRGIYDCTDDVNGGNATDANSLMVYPAEAGSTDSEKIVWCQHPANFWMLFVDPLGTGWNKDAKRGWNGPYLQRKSGLEAVDADFNNDGSLATESDSLQPDLWVVSSPYGTPYFLFDLNDNDTARIQSLGANHDYDDATGADDCLPPIDPVTGESLDDVLCLLR